MRKSSIDVVAFFVLLAATGFSILTVVILLWAVVKLVTHFT